MDLVIIGSANIDETLNVEFLPLVGQTIFANNLAIMEGGKGANQAVAAARLGAKCVFVGCLGDDWYGKRIRNKLLQENIDDRFIHLSTTQPTGKAMIMVDKNGKNMIAVLSGANNEITPEHISNCFGEISRAKVMLLQNEIPSQSICRAAVLAADAGITIIYNPAPAKKMPDELYKNVTCIVPNQEEAVAITGIDSSDGNLQMQAEWFHDRQIPVVLITLGEKGVYLSITNKFLDEAGNRFITAQKVKAIDTVAAGDCFCGALAARIAKGDSWHEAARIACMVASISVTRRGGMDSLPSLSENEKIFQ